MAQMGKALGYYETAVRGEGQMVGGIPVLEMLTGSWD